MIYIKQIKIQDFKNFNTEQTFSFTKGTNILAGKNGIGKTTILNAVTWCLINRMFDGSTEGWKPKELYVDVDGNILSKQREFFNTCVELTLAFDDGQKDIIVKRTSFSGKGTTLYYNGITDTQKQINKYLKNALGFDIARLLILINPEILFNQDEVPQEECGRLIFDSVRNTVTKELEELYNHIFDEYNTNVELLELDSLESSIAKRLLKSVQKQLDNNVSENDIIEDLETKIADNNLVLETKTNDIKSQELVLEEYNLHLKQEPAYRQLEKNLDRIEQIYRDKDFKRQRLQQELVQLIAENDKLKVWLHDFNNLLLTNPSVIQLKKAFGYKVEEKYPEQTAKINVINISNQKQRCPVCGNWYIPKQDPKQQEIAKKLAEINKEITSTNAKQPEVKPEDEKFDYIPDLTKIKQTIADYTIQIDDLKSQIETIDKDISHLEFKTRDEIQAERNRISTFFASLETGKTIQNQVNKMKDNCIECNLNNRYLNILHLTLSEYQKAKLKIIMKKLNSNLTSGIITLFKLQANGVIKESVTILDRDSSVEYKETNQSKKIKLGIEVCKLLQDFNNINFPIFIDEIGRFSDYSFINNLGHQIIATLPTRDETLRIINTENN